MQKLLQKCRLHDWKKEHMLNNNFYLLQSRNLYTAEMKVHSHLINNNYSTALNAKEFFPKIMKFKSLVVKKVSEVYQFSINKRKERMECQRSWKSMPPGRSRPNAIADSIVMHGKSHYGKWKNFSLPRQHCICSHAKTKESPLTKRLIVYNFCQASDLRGQWKSRGILI